jgi:uncharacterized protein (TIGR02996 family)
VLRKAVFEDPDSDDARLVYADYLMEQGDPQGEFIRASLDEEAAGARKRRKALKRKYEHAWLGKARTYLRSWEFERGFVEHVEADAGAFIKGCAALVAISPSLCVELTKLTSKQIPALAKCPLGKVHSLYLKQFRLTDQDAAVLFASKQLAGVRELDLFANRFGPETGRAIAKSPCTALLRTLELANNELGDAGAAAILGASWPELRELDLGQSGITKLELAGRFPKLEELDLADNPIGDAGAAVLVASKLKLEVLRVGNCGMSERSVRALEKRFSNVSA